MIKFEKKLLVVSVFFPLYNITVYKRHFSSFFFLQIDGKDESVRRQDRIDIARNSDIRLNKRGKNLIQNRPKQSKMEMEEISKRPHVRPTRKTRENNGNGKYKKRIDNV